MREQILMTLTGLVFALGHLAFGASAKAQESIAVDLKKSEFNWRADKKITSGHHGKIFLKSGQVQKVDGKIASAEFVMDMNSFTVTDLRGRRARQFMDHVKSGDFFLVEQFPTARLVLESITMPSQGSEPSSGVASGQLTIKDQTHPISVNFSEEKGLYRGTLTFDRTQYGITYNSENFVMVAADRIIRDEVHLDFKVALKDSKEN